jgi:glycosyl transferase, family 25
VGKLKDIVIGATFSVYNSLAKQLPSSRSLPKEAFSALNEFFDARWVLSIQRNAERHPGIRDELRGLDFEFFWGVDGKALAGNDRRYDLERARRLYGREVHVNELACTMSHLEIFETILEKGLKRVLVLEDDAVPISSHSSWVSRCLEGLPQDWELFYMGYRDGELRGFLREAQELLGRRRDDTEVVSRRVGKGIRTAALHDFTHAYAVTYSGAMRMLENAYPVYHTADGWLEENVRGRKLKAYISVPKLFAQRADIVSSLHS